MSIQCRSCTSTTSAEYIDLITALAENISYLDYFNQCTQLNAKIGDGLPSSLCTNCKHDLQVSFDFVRMAKQADTALRSNPDANHKTSVHELTYDEFNDLENGGAIIIEEVLPEQIDVVAEDVTEDIVAEELLECEEADMINDENLEVVLRKFLSLLKSCNI